MELLPVETISGKMSLEEAKEELARIAGLLENTTDSTLFNLRLSSIGTLVTLLKEYRDLELNQYLEAQAVGKLSLKTAAE